MISHFNKTVAVLVIPVLSLLLAAGFAPDSRVAACSKSLVEESSDSISGWVFTALGVMPQEPGLLDSGAPRQVDSAPPLDTAGSPPGPDSPSD